MTLIHNAFWKTKQSLEISSPWAYSCRVHPSAQQCQRLLRVLFILWKHRAQGLGSRCRHCLGIARCQPCQISQSMWDFPYGIARSRAGHSSWTHPPSTLRRTWGSARGTCSCPVELLGRTAVVCPSALHRPSASIVPKSAVMALPRTTQGCFCWEFGCLCRNIFSSKLSHAIAMGPRALLHWWGFFLDWCSEMAGAGTSARGSNSSATPIGAAALMVIVWDLQVENSRANT